MNLTINGTTTATTVDTLGALLGPLPPGCAVAVNGEVVPRADVPGTRLAEGDVVELVTAVAGG